MKHFASLLVLVAALLMTAVNGFITGLTAPTAPFTVTASSKMSVVFATSNSPTNAEDFALTCGLALASEPISGNALGDTILETFNLIALGHARTGTGSFTLGIPINTTNAGGFGSGNFILSCGTQSAFGAFFFAQVNMFRGNITLVN